MNRDAGLIIGLVLSLLWAGCATNEQTASNSEERSAAPAPVIDPASVELTNPWHFAAPDGSHVVAGVGTYHLDDGEASQLRLIPADGTAPLLITALVSEHDVDLVGPLALMVSVDENSQHLIIVGRPPAPSPGGSEPAADNVQLRGGDGIGDGKVTRPGIRT